MSTANRGAVSPWLEGEEGPCTLGPLRCPACGSRGRHNEKGSIWMDGALVRVDEHGQAQIVLSPGIVSVWLDCSRCDHQGTLEMFEPPWREPTARRRLHDGRIVNGLPEGVSPLPLSDEDLREEAAWFVSEFWTSHASVPCEKVPEG